MENPKAPGAFKAQPWILFDTVSALSFLLGETDTTKYAIGTQLPAISRSGELVFFSAGRTRASVEHLTNMDQNAQLAFGFEVWQIYVHAKFPFVNPYQADGYDVDGTFNGLSGIAPTLKLYEAILSHAILELKVGQEEQVSFPVDRFGAGGGIWGPNAVPAMNANNGIPAGANVLCLPEAISIPRTTNISAKIKLEPEVFGLVGSNAVPGVGNPLAPYNYTYGALGVDESDLQQAPYQVQVGLVGRRVKDTQYGQIAKGPNA